MNFKIAKLIGAGIVVCLGVLARDAELISVGYSLIDLASLGAGMAVVPATDKVFDAILRRMQ